MSWRPEGWKEKKDEWFRHSARSQLLDGSVFEAGADAMLEVLKETGAWMTPEQMKLLAPDRKYPYGYLVFIPADKVDASQEELARSVGKLVLLGVRRLLKVVMP